MGWVLQKWHYGVVDEVCSKIVRLLRHLSLNNTPDISAVAQFTARGSDTCTAYNAGSNNRKQERNERALSLKR